MSATARNLHRIIYLGIAGMATAISLIDADVPYTVQLALLVVCVALLGVPHGALDPVLAHAYGIAPTRRRLVRFMLLYLAQAISVVLLWWVAPGLALASFLLLSIWHFRSDWHAELGEWQGLSAAATVVCAPTIFHPQAVREIFAALAFGTSVEWLLLFSQTIGVAAVTAVALSALGNVKARPHAALELMTLPLLAWALPPLLFFIVYFCGLHSPRHLIESLRATRARCSTIILAGSAVAAATIAVAIGAHMLLPIAASDSRLIVIVFVGLAALTVPHMLLIERTKQRECLSALCKKRGIVPLSLD